MTNEQFARWADRAGLTAAQIADDIEQKAETHLLRKFTVGSIYNFRCGATPITGNFELVLLKVYPHDKELWECIGFKWAGCPHCYDGLVGDDQEYNQPKYCQHCRQGLQFESSRIIIARDTLYGVHRTLSSIPHDERNGNWLDEYLKHLMVSIAKHNDNYVKVENKLAELEATK